MTAIRSPRIIQGGMGVAISDWRLARTVSMTGQLGVVSGTALEILCARRLQDGDPGGDVRRALAHFPIPEIAERVLSTYYVAGGKAPDAPYRPVLRYTLQPGRTLQELTVAGNFVEVYLAKEGHDGLVGVNYLRKIELPIPFAMYGAMLAGVDYVLMGAGNPAEIPALLDRLACHDPVGLSIRVQGATSADGDYEVRFDPRSLWSAEPPTLRRPLFNAIVASVDLAEGLAGDAATRPDGFVVEGYTAGGHNAPPRGPRRLDETGQLIYGERDIVQPHELAALGIPFWMAGSYGTPSDVARAVAAGAAGVQVGTVFALSRESGLVEVHKRRLLDQAARGEVQVRSDPRVSPTGFPFKTAQLEGTLSDERVYADRPRICDLAVLRSAYRKPDGSTGYRCPSEPVDAYAKRGGREDNTVGRRCVCNALIATAGFGQVRANGYVEPAIVTAGDDFRGVRHLVELARARDEDGYSAREVVEYLLSELPAEQLAVRERTLVSAAAGSSVSSG